MQLSYFDGFPYLLTRVDPSVYHIAVLPAALGLDNLTSIARLQVDANKLDTCLVLDRTSCVYFEPDGTERPSAAIPYGGIVFADRLHLCERFAASPELLCRQERLRAFVADMPVGAIFGDLTKGGRRATADDVDRLERCRTCGDWCGECLDAGMVVTVCCYCQNHTYCAHCGHPFAERRVNANYYDGRVWHVPGFAAFGHRCRVFTVCEQDMIGCMISSRVVLSVEAHSRQWLLHVKCDEGDEGFEDEVGPIGAADLVEELEVRGYRIEPFIQGLRRYDEPQLNRLARQIEGRYAR